MKVTAKNEVQLLTKSESSLNFVTQHSECIIGLFNNTITHERFVSKLLTLARYDFPYLKLGRPDDFLTSSCTQTLLPPPYGDW